jgi:hypothetical protein
LNCSRELRRRPRARVRQLRILVVRAGFRG